MKADVGKWDQKITSQLHQRVSGRCLENKKRIAMKKLFANERWKQLLAVRSSAAPQETD